MQEGSKSQVFSLIFQKDCKALKAFFLHGDIQVSRGLVELAETIKLIKGLGNIQTNLRLNSRCARKLDVALGEFDPCLIFAFADMRAVMLWNKLKDSLIDWLHWKYVNIHVESPWYEEIRIMMLLILL